MDSYNQILLSRDIHLPVYAVSLNCQIIGYLNFVHIQYQNPPSCAILKLKCVNEQEFCEYTLYCFANNAFFFVKNVFQIYVNYLNIANCVESPLIISGLVIYFLFIDKASKLKDVC